MAIFINVQNILRATIPTHLGKLKSNQFWILYNTRILNINTQVLYDTLGRWQGRVQFIPCLVAPLPCPSYSFPCSN